ncbi:MAG: hypothetical protein ACOC0C_01130 [Bacteroidota bacterium]
MKKSSIILSILFLNVLISQAQDLIVTDDSDSLNCEITEITPENIYFTFEFEGRNINTLLPRNKILTYKKNYFQIETETITQPMNSSFYHEFRIALEGGFSRRTAKIPDNIPNDYEDYINELKSGYNFEAGLTYYFSEMIGLGICYSQFGASNEMENVWLQDIYGNRTYGLMRDDIFVHFFGPVLSTRFYNYNKKSAFFADFGLGYLGYDNDAIFVNDIHITGKTVGVSMDLGYDIGLSDNIAMGFEISVVSGTLTELEVSSGSYSETRELEKDEYENLGRFDFSIGLRFHL